MNIVSRNFLKIILISVPRASVTADMTRHKAQQMSACVGMTVPYGYWINWAQKQKAPNEATGNSALTA
jgi:hypothetical protein